MSQVSALHNQGHDPSIAVGSELGSLQQRMLQSLAQTGTKPASNPDAAPLFAVVSELANYIRLL